MDRSNPIHIIASVLVISSLAAGPVLAADECVHLGVKILRYDATMNKIGVFKPDGVIFDYGDNFEVQLTSNLPGTFKIETVNPKNERNSFPSVFSDGTKTVLFPCGFPGICTEPDQKFVLMDDLSGAATGTHSDETMVIYYMPCATGDHTTDGALNKILPFLERCDSHPTELLDDKVASTYERIALTPPKNEVCEHCTEDGQVVLTEKIVLTVKR